MFVLQFFLPFGEDKINNLIEKEIVEADRIGVKVIALGGLVKVLCIHSVSHSSFLPHLQEMNT